LQHAVPATEQHVVGRPWPKGMSGNPTGIRISKHALKLFYEIAAELGGVDSLPAMDAALLLQATRLLVRSSRLKDHDAAIRMSSEARRTLEGLRRRCAPAVRSAPTEPFGQIVVSAEAEAAPRRAAELAADAAKHGERLAEKAPKTKRLPRATGSPPWGPHEPQAIQASWAPCHARACRRCVTGTRSYVTGTRS
jgi:hypothetical protein